MKQQIGTHELHHTQADAIGDFGAACQRAHDEAFSFLNHVSQAETGVSLESLMPKAPPVDTTLMARLTSVDAVTASIRFWSTLFTPVPVIQVVSLPKEETV